jgi:uncharacterized phage infection (PIP) family protein YhgE
MLVGLAKQSKSVHSEFKGNLKAYNASVDKLRSQLDESIKLSRALTAKWDLVCLRHADILAQLDELDSPLSKIADADAKAAKIADLRKKLEDEGRKMAKFIAYDPAGVEEAFQKARMEIINHCAPDVFEKRLGQVEDFVGRVDNLVGAAGTVLGGLAK